MYDIEHLFMWFLPSVFLLWFTFFCLFRSFTHYLIGWSSYGWVLRVLCISGYVFIKYVLYDYFLPVCGLSFNSLKFILYLIKIEYNALQVRIFFLRIFLVKFYLVGKFSNMHNRLQFQSLSQFHQWSIEELRANFSKFGNNSSSRNCILM